MYARDVTVPENYDENADSKDAGKKTINLAVSGMLWDRSLVMADVETKSLWSQLLGRAMRGPLEGAELDRFASVMTDWKTWYKLHPDTTVMQLSRTDTEFTRDRIYKDPGEFVIGMAGSGKVRAWPFDQLIDRPVVNDQFAGVPVVVLLDAASFTAQVFERTVKDQTLTFESSGETITDRETGTEWDALRGKAISGSLAGEQLKPLAAIVSFRKAWKIFHPETEVYSADD